MALMRNLHTQLKEPSERIWFLWYVEPNRWFLEKAKTTVQDAYVFVLDCSRLHRDEVSVVEPCAVCACPAGFGLRVVCEGRARFPRGQGSGKCISSSLTRPLLMSTQDIMLRLQQKAHTSLEQWRRGLALQREPGGAGEEDELTVLGGQTRLVKKEPISPTIIDRSPHSHNPVVPLPLSPAAETRLGPGVLDYLTSFGHQNGHGHPHHQSFSEAVDMSPLSAPGYPSLMPPSAYGGGEGAYGPMQDSNGMMGNGHGMQHQQDGGHGTFGPGFPQYFPVFDYGSGEAGGYGAAGDGYGKAGDEYGKVGNGFGKAYGEGTFGNGVPMMDPHPMPNGRAHGMAGVDAGMGMDEGMGVDGRRGSTGSPEAMSWNDFVNVVAMN